MYRINEIYPLLLMSQPTQKTYPQPPDNHSTHRIEKAKKQGANKPQTQLPVLYLILRAGAGVGAGGGRADGVRDF